MRILHANGDDPRSTDANQRTNATRSEQQAISEAASVERAQHGREAMITSGYDNPDIDKLIAGLADNAEGSPGAKIEKQVASVFKKAAESAYDNALDIVQQHLLENMSEAIRDAVSQTANRVIESALAGDIETFASLFGLAYNWESFGAHFRDGKLPLGVELRRKLLDLHHDQFTDKIIADMKGEIEALNKTHDAKMKGTRAAHDRQFNDERQKHAHEMAEAVDIMCAFLDCAEIADCAPDDKEPETDAAERRARQFIQTHT